MRDKQDSVGLCPLPVVQVSYICTGSPHEITQIKDFALVARSMHQYNKLGVCDKWNVNIMHTYLSFTN